MSAAAAVTRWRWIWAHAICIISKGSIMCGTFVVFGNPGDIPQLVYYDMGLRAAGWTHHGWYFAMQLKESITCLFRTSVESGENYLSNATINAIRCALYLFRRLVKPATTNKVNHHHVNPCPFPSFNCLSFPTISYAYILYITFIYWYCLLNIHAISIQYRPVNLVLEPILRESGHIAFHWLEISRTKASIIQYIEAQSNLTLNDTLEEFGILPREADCEFKCPELDACIDGNLWCDGKYYPKSTT